MDACIHASIDRSIRVVLAVLHIEVYLTVTM